MGSCQNYGPFLGTLNNRCRTIIGTQKGAIILTTTHIFLRPGSTSLDPQTPRLEHGFGAKLEMFRFGRREGTGLGFKGLGFKGLGFRVSLNPRPLTLTCQPGHVVDLAAQPVQCMEDYGMTSFGSFFPGCSKLRDGAGTKS